MSFKSSSGDGEGRKDKGGGERLCVKVCEKIVCIMYVCMYMYVCTYVRMYVWMYVCVCVWQSCAWKMVCVKVMCAFCWLSSVEENRTSLLLSVFLGSMGLARKQRASPGAQRKPTQSEVTPCLQICFACFGRFEILEFVQCWVLFMSGCFYVFAIKRPLDSDLPQQARVARSGPLNVLPSFLRRAR